MKKTKFIILFAALTSQAWAVFPFNLTSNGSSVISGGSWSGNGTIQPNATPGTNSPSNFTILVEDFTSGNLDVNDMSSFMFSGGTPRLKDVPFGFNHQITVTGGTADLRLANSNNNDGGTNLWNSTGLTGFGSGVTSFSFTTTFDSPIASRQPSSTDLFRFPMLSGLALINAGKDNGLESYHVTMSFGGLEYNASPNTSLAFDSSLPGYTSGIPSVATARTAVGLTQNGPGLNAFTAPAFHAIDEFLLVRNFDHDGTGATNNSADGPRFYANSITWTVSADAGTIPNDALFVFSLDGQQYGTAIPEPSSLMLLGGALVSGLVVRRRKA